MEDSLNCLYGTIERKAEGLKYFATEAAGVTPV